MYSQQRAGLRTLAAQPAFHRPVTMKRFPSTHDNAPSRRPGQLGVPPAGSRLSANELLKQQRIVQELKATTERQAAAIALQEGQIKALTVGLKQQADQIQKVTAQLEASKPAPQVVNNP